MVTGIAITVLTKEGGDTVGTEGAGDTKALNVLVRTRFEVVVPRS